MTRKKRVAPGTYDNVTKGQVCQALVQAGGTKVLAAEILGMSPRTLGRLWKKHGISAMAVPAPTEAAPVEAAPADDGNDDGDGPLEEPPPAHEAGGGTEAAEAMSVGT